MFNICICDDNYNFLLNLKANLKKIASKNNIEVNIITYSIASQLLFDIDEHKDNIDIYFLDVLMGKFSGIDLANKIRTYDSLSQIIFLTSSKEHVFTALDVMPLHYLIKQELNLIKLEEVFIKAINIIKPNKKNLFYYKVGHDIKSINTNQIIFFEIKNRIVTITSINGDNDKFYFSMKNLVKQLSHTKFVQVHRSFLINPYYIKAIEGKTLILSNNTTLPIGEKYIKNLKLNYTKFLLNDFNTL